MAASSQTSQPRMIDSIWRDVERRYPQPIAVVIQRLQNSTRDDWQARTNVLIDTLGSTLQYLAAVAFLDCLANVDDNAFATSRLAQLQTPMSDGKWAGLLRDSVQRLATVEQAFMPELVKQYDRRGKRNIRKLIDELVSVRNRFAHGGTDDSQRFELYQLFNETLTELLSQLDFLSNYVLISVQSSHYRARVKYHRCRFFTGNQVDEVTLECEIDLEGRHALLLDHHRGQMLNIYPFYVVDEKPYGARLYRFAGASNGAVEFQSTGSESHRDPEAWHYLQALETFGELLPRLHPSQLQILLPEGLALAPVVAPATTVEHGPERKSPQPRTRVPSAQKAVNEPPTTEPVPQLPFKAASVETTAKLQVVTAPKVELPAIGAAVPAVAQVATLPPAASSAIPNKALAAITPAPTPPANGSLRQQLDSLLDSFFRHTREDADFAVLLSDHLRSYLAGREATIRARLSDLFSLVVIGEFKRGKSTLVNALLGAEIAPADVTPETITINELRYGPSPQAEAVLEDGARMLLNPAELRAGPLVERLVAIDRAAGVAGGLYRLSAAQLSRLLAEHCDAGSLAALAASIGLEQALTSSEHRERATELVLAARRERKTRALISAAQQQNPRLGGEVERAGSSISQTFPDLDSAAQRVDHIDLRMPLPWLAQVRLVDTPGLGQMPVFDAQVQTYLAEADAIVFVVSALQPFAESERIFLQHMLRVTNGTPLLFVINRIDQVRKVADAQRLIATITSRIHSVSPEAPIFALSAQDELDRQLAADATSVPHAELDNFAGFRAALDESILRNRDLIQIDRAVHELMALINEVRASIVFLETATSASAAERTARIAQYSDQQSQMHQHIRSQVMRVERELAEHTVQTCDWMDGFIDRFVTEALPAIESVAANDLSQHYIFFLAESVRDALEACLEAQRPIIQELLTNVRVTTQHAIASGTIDSATSQRLNALVHQAIFDERSWNGVESLQFVVDQSMQRLFGTTRHALLRLVGQRLQQRASEQAQRTAFRERLTQALPELRQSLRVELRALYDDLARTATAQITAAAQQEIDTALAMLRQAEAQPTGDGPVETARQRRAIVWLDTIAERARAVQPDLS